MAAADTELEDLCRPFEADRMRSVQLRYRARLLGRRVHAARSALAETIDASHRALDVSQAACASIGPPNVPAWVIALAGLDEGNLGDVADRLIAAYRTALDRDDAEMRAALRPALLSIGRHLAERVGPRAAGILSS